MISIHMNKAAFVREVHSLFRDGRRASNSWRKDAREDYGFYSGEEQWTSEDRQYLEDNDRPMVTFNRTSSIVDAVSGMEEQNRQEVTYFPREAREDAQAAEMYTSAAAWVRDGNNAEDEESDAFTDTMICGMGWTETWVDFDGADAEIKTDRIDPLEMYWDPKARKRNILDSKWRMRIPVMDKSDVRERWPNSRLSVKPQDFFDNPEIVDEPHDADEAKFYKNDQSGRALKRNEIRVAQIQWWEKETFFRVEQEDPNNPDASIQVDVNQDGLSAIRDQFDEEQAPSVRLTTKRFYQAFVAGSTLLERRELHPGDTGIPGFTLQCITGKRDHNENTWFGVVRVMKDPQRWSNKFFSMILDILNSNAKGGAFAEVGAFQNQREAEEKWSRADALIFVNDGALQNKRIQERGMAGIPPGLDRLMGFAVGSQREVSGINVELLGQAERTQAGVVEASRIRQSVITLSRIFNNLRLYRKTQGRVLLHLINRYVPENTMIRVLGSDRYEPFKPGTFKFDLIVDQSPTSPNAKEQIWQTLTQILPAMIRAGLPIPPAIIKYMPLPASVIREMQQFYEGLQPGDADKQMEEMAKQLALAKEQGEVGLLEAKKISELAKAFSNVEARELDRVKVALENDQANNENIVKLLETMGTLTNERRTNGAG